MKFYEVNKIYQTKVTCIKDYGVFVDFEDGYTGLIHISEISRYFVKNINDFLQVGDVINVKVIAVDEKNKQLNLSIKNIKYKKNAIKKVKKIEETEHGFLTLKANLPIWIEKKLKKIEKMKNSLDK